MSFSLSSVRLIARTSCAVSWSATVLACLLEMEGLGARTCYQRMLWASCRGGHHWLGKGNDSYHGASPFREAERGRAAPVHKIVPLPCGRRPSQGVQQRCTKRTGLGKHMFLLRDEEVPRVLL